MATMLVITMPPTRLFRGFRLPFEKWWPDRLLYATIFKRVLHILRKFESSESNELIGVLASGLIAFSSKRRLIRISETEK